MKAKRKPFVCGQKLLGKSEVFTMPCDCEYGTCNDGLMEVWEKGKKSVVFTRCMLKNSYEQGKKEQEEFDIRVIKAMKFNHQQEINETRKQTLEESLLLRDAEKKALAKTIIRDLLIEMNNENVGCLRRVDLELKLKELSK